MPAQPVCVRCESPLEVGDLRCAICGESTPVERISNQSDTLTVDILRCEGCGAAVRYSAELQAAHCVFCGSILRQEQVQDPLEQTETYLPFTIDPAGAQQGLLRWFDRQGFFRVQDLRRRAALDGHKPLWWVGWVFDAEALVSWAADTDAGSGRSAWAPHAGQEKMVFDDVVVSASRGLSLSETDALASSYDPSSGEAAPRGPAGAFDEQFELQRSLARQRVLQGVESTASARVVRGSLPGSRHRKLKVALLLMGLTTRRYAFPAYVLAYRYRGNLYRAVVSGQDSERVYGKAPLSVARVLVFAALIALFLGAVLAVLGGLA